MRRSRKDISGFTLMELRVAAGILAFAIVGLLSTFIYGSVLGVTNRGLVIAASDAQYVLERLKDQPYADLATYTDTSFDNLVDESILVTVTTLTGERDIEVNVTWTEGQRQRSYVLTTKVAF